MITYDYTDGRGERDGFHIPGLLFTKAEPCYEQERPIDLNIAPRWMETVRPMWFAVRGVQ